MTIMTNNILILGLAGSGKSTMAINLAKKHQLKYINVDKYRYKNGWNRVDKFTFINNVLESLDKQGNIIDTSYNDASDNSNARIELVEQLIPTCKKIIIIKSTNITEHIANIIDRSIKRANGEEEGVCKETSINRASLVIKCVNNYDNNINKIMERFYDLIDDKFVIYKTRDELYDIFEI